ncbi:MAG: hypothetical protein WBC78_23765 [Candidatus Sulfotelmatobacter sp.]
MERAISRSVRLIEFFLAGVGFYISLRLPKRLQSRGWIVGPVAAVLVGVALAGVLVAWKAESAGANRAARELREQVAKESDQLNEILLAQARVDANLQAMQSSVAESKKTAAMNLRTLEKIGRQTQSAKVRKAHLYHRTMALVKRIREMHFKQSSENRQRWDMFIDSSRQAGTTEQIRLISARNVATEQGLHAAQEYELQMKLLGEAQYVAGELQRRLPNLPAPEAEVRIALTGHLIGVDPLLELANYLEVAAKKLRQ